MSRFTDFAIYIAIGLSCVGAAVALADLGALFRALGFPSRYGKNLTRQR